MINLEHENQHQVRHIDSRVLVTKALASTNNRPKLGNTL
jgi:hypothetical protein